MKQLLLFASLCILFDACTQKKSADSSSDAKPSKEQNEIGVIDITQTNYPKKECEIEMDYIPLETRDDVLLDRTLLLSHLSESRIVIANSGYNKGDIFIFDGKGKIVSKFKHKGQGPQEYVNIGQLVYDEKSREVFIFDLKKRCQVYSEDGVWLRTLQFPEYQSYTVGGGYAYCAFNFDDETMFLHNDNKNSDSTFVFLSKKDGSVQSAITLPLSYRISNVVEKKVGDMYWSYSVDFPNICKNGDIYYLSELSSDTIYQLGRDKQLRPFIVKKSSSGKDDEMLDVVNIIKATDKYILFMIIRYDISFKNPNNPNNFNSQMLLYEFETQQTFTPDFKKGFSLGVSTRINASVSTKNQIATFYNMDRLKKQLDEDQLEGKLKEITEKAAEDDNPVLQIITLN
ncbi:MAG: 6-bladed beta-propeller [Tannerella sp.]|nr:6-bladed beta-propeller [Tannerella sp.]